MNDTQSTEEVRAERDFLYRRMTDRSGAEYVGLSSTAMVRAAMEGRSEAEEWPRDRGDLGRCERTYEAAPAHLAERMRPVLERFRGQVAELEAERRRGAEEARKAAIASGELEESYEFVQPGAQVRLKVSSVLADEIGHDTAATPGEAEFDLMVELHELLQGALGEVVVDAEVQDVMGERADPYRTKVLVSSADVCGGAPLWVSASELAPAESAVGG